MSFFSPHSSDLYQCIISQQQQWETATNNERTTGFIVQEIRERLRTRHTKDYFLLVLMLWLLSGCVSAGERTFPVAAYYYYYYY
mmetsp:Transcript_5030/g.7100  ORF Transcript_5030/g.7100 Transcript_5030/m.7100 type:complete len:84 (+) Transcript_5030:1004-1255(+)